MTTNNIINIAIVDDDSLVVQLLTNFLEKSKDPLFNVILTADSGNEFIRRLNSKSFESPDVLLLDMRMQDGNGLEVLEKLRNFNYNIKVIVLTSYYKPSYIGQMMNLGAHAFLPKEIDKEELISTIKEIYLTGHFFRPEQIQALRTQIAPKTPKMHLEPKDQITARELEILRLITQQHTTKEIANKLFIATKTVEAHKSNLLSKTGAKNSAGLVMFAIKNELINPDDFF